MSEWRCVYDKTLRGSCDQQRLRGDVHCYYHKKVVDGLMTDVDENTVMRGMPTIKN